MGVDIAIDEWSNSLRVAAMYMLWPALLFECPCTLHTGTAFCSFWRQSPKVSSFRLSIMSVVTIALDPGHSQLFEFFLGLSARYLECVFQVLLLQQYQHPSPPLLLQQFLSIPIYRAWPSWFYLTPKLILFDAHLIASNSIDNWQYRLSKCRRI